MQPRWWRRPGVALLAAAVLLPLVVPGRVEAAGTTATPVMGRNVLVADQLAAWYRSTGRTPSLHGVTLEELARLFIEEGAAEGVRGDVAFAQAIFETDYFRFSETVPPHTNNFAGIGAPNSVASFPNARVGVRAQIQHLRAYADSSVARTGTAQPLVDPRFDLVNPKGQVTTFEELSGRWSGGTTYGLKVVGIYGRILAHAGPSLRGQALGAPVVDLSNAVGGGVWLLDAAGGVFTLGGAKFFGSIPGRRASGQIIGFAQGVAIAATPTRLGYWVLDRDGGVHAFGDARFLGSVPGRRAAGEPIGSVEAVSLAPTASGNGYWILDAAGGVHAFGDARYLGSIPGRRATGQAIGNVRAVALAATASGDGYWVLDAAGGIHSFGDAVFSGSIPGRRAAGQPIGDVPVVDLAPSPRGGYWVLDAVGGIFTFGGAPFLGTLADDLVGVPIADLSATATGYRIGTADGGVFSYG